MDKKNKRYRIVSISLTVFDIISNVITFINGISKTTILLSKILGSFLSHFLIYFNAIFLLPIAIFLATTAIISYSTRQYRKSIGTHGIPCSLISMFHFKIANKNNKLLNSIHRDIYHHYYKIKDDIESQRIGSVENAKKAIGELLRVIHSSILKTFKMDLTINIKVNTYEKGSTSRATMFVNTETFKTLGIEGKGLDLGVFTMQYKRIR